MPPASAGACTENEKTEPAVAPAAALDAGAAQMRAYLLRLAEVGTDYEKPYVPILDPELEHEAESENINYVFDDDDEKHALPRPATTRDSERQSRCARRSCRRRCVVLHLLFVAAVLSLGVLALRCAQRPRFEVQVQSEAQNLTQTSASVAEIISTLQRPILDDMGRHEGDGQLQ